MSGNAAGSAIPRGAGGLPVNLLTLTITQYHRDFRKYLMGAAERSGGKALHILCEDKLILSWAGAERAEYSTSRNSFGLRQIISDHLQPGPILGLTGLGATRLDERAVTLATNLHKDLSDVHWIYDVYDDFMYNAEGSDRVRRLTADAVWRCRCEHSIILDPELRSRYPTAYHLDNASHVEHLPSVATVDARKMVYIGSIDRRVDFEWLDALAANDVTIDIFGSIHTIGAAETQQQLECVDRAAPQCFVSWPVRERRSASDPRPVSGRTSALPRRPPDDRPCESGQTAPLLERRP